MKFYSKDKMKIIVIRNYQYGSIFLNSNIFVMNLKESNFENQQKLEFLIMAFEN